LGELTKRYEQLKIINRFKDATFEQFYSELFDKIKLTIASEQDDFIIAQLTKELVKYYSKQILRLIEFDWIWKKVSTTRDI
jgi:hypothetical protein